MSEIKQSIKTTNNEQDKNKRGGYTRKKVDKAQLFDFLRNLALVRETVRMLYKEDSSVSVESIYEYLGTNSKELTNIFDTGNVSRKKLQAIQDKLTEIGFYKNHFATSRVCSIVVPADVDTLLSEMLYADNGTDREEHATKLRQSIELHYIKHDEQIGALVLNCYRLMYYATNNDEWNFYTASATLEKLLQVDLGNISKTNSHYIEFIKNLSKSCSHFGITQTTPIRNIMTETSAMLSILCQTDITADDVASQECAQLLHQMAQTMLIINDSINSKLS